MATLVYGDYEHPKVKILRNFRDQYLLTNKFGQQFVKFYYKHSPNWVKRLKNHPVVNSIIKSLLNIFCYFLGASVSWVGESPRFYHT
ncbi:MAG: CFI-box-CTERM domain-containing protein [Succinivibrionaceae bacterium]